MFLMKPLSHFKREARAAIIGVLCDIDDTLTTDGRLPAIAYRALEDLKSAGFRVVPVTGRPAGWCDMIARFWPVDGVVGENGAFYYRYDHGAKRMTRRFAQSEAERATGRAKLAALGTKILAEVPGSAIAADQAFRDADLAIDFCEDVKPLSSKAVSRIREIFEAGGATAKVSSIHVNAWFGTYDKLTMTKLFLSEALSTDVETERQRWVFVGDLPNDAPMFGYFPHAVGVANVRRALEPLAAEPAYVTDSEGGAGFAELAATLLAARPRP